MPKKHTSPVVSFESPPYIIFFTLYTFSISNTLFRCAQFLHYTHFQAHFYVVYVHAAKWWSCRLFFALYTFSTTFLHSAHFSHSEQFQTKRIRCVYFQVLFSCSIKTRFIRTANVTLQASLISSKKNSVFFPA